MHKIITKFNEWYQQNNMNKTRIISLSKDTDKSNYPEVGNIGIIAIVPLITKLFELCIL